MLLLAVTLATAAVASAQAPTAAVTLTADGATRTLTPDALQSFKDAGYTLESPYGYTPSLSSTVAYTVVFALLTIVHLVLAVKFKYASAIATMVAGGVLEVIGWAGRLWSHKNVLLWDPFIMQICCLIIGPVFFSAWVSRPAWCESRELTARTTRCSGSASSTSGHSTRSCPRTRTSLCSSPPTLSP